MNRPSQITLILLALVVVAFGSCSRHTPNEPEDVVEYTSLNWVGTEVVYREVPGKRDLSIIFFLADWCGWCTRFKNETLTDTDVIQILGESFNIVDINYEADSSVVHYDSTVTCYQLSHDIYGVRGYPTYAFLKRNGDLIAKSSGFRLPAGFIEVLEIVRNGEF